MSCSCVLNRIIAQIYTFYSVIHVGTEKSRIQLNMLWECERSRAGVIVVLKCKLLFWFCFGYSGFVTKLWQNLNNKLHAKTRSWIGCARADCVKQCLQEICICNLKMCNFSPFGVLRAAVCTITGRVRNRFPAPASAL